MANLPEPVLRPFCTLLVEVGPAQILGQGRFGQRRIVPILGGTVSGPGVSGTILSGGDRQTVNADGVAEYEARYAFETNDGATIEIVDTGFRHGPADIMRQLAAGEPVPPDAYYMRSSVKLETSHPDYQWVNGTMFVSTGSKTGDTVQIDLYAVE
jgi:hypothetical protein